MNVIFKSKSTRLLSAFLAVLMVVAMLPVTAFAWTAEEGTKCTSTYGDLYLGSDGNNYYSKAGNTLFYNDDGSFYVSYHSGGVARYKYLMIDSNGTSHHVYCIESGVSYNYSDTYNSTSGKNSKYNPLGDPEISALVYDVFCLLHSYDWAESGDTDMNDYQKDVEIFKNRWFKKTRKDRIKEMIDISTEKLKEDLYQAFGLETESSSEL